MSKRTLVLGSSSPFRRAILDKLHLDYQVAKPDIDETPLADEAPQTLVARLAEQKARAVAKQNPDFADAIIIGSDQVAVCDGDILGKPHSTAKAVAQLQRFVGKTVVFLTGLCVYDARTDKADVICVPFSVKFRNDLTTAELQQYVELEQPLNCAGSFKSEGLGISLFDSLIGDDPNTLIGLPCIELLRMLRKHQINPLAGDNSLA